MKSAVSERLVDLERVARRLADLIDGERPDAMLPALLVCRVAVTADKAASELAAYLDVLTAGTATTADPRRPVPPDLYERQAHP